MMHQIIREQQLNCSLDKAWEFFSSANKLSVITPEDMNFTVLTDFEDDDIYEGMIIDYEITPIFNIKMHWQTEIIKVDHKKNFVDFQAKGPYKTWHHYHEFIENEEGVLVKDVVDYELPLGIIGDIVHKLFVRKKLDYIFNYRKEVLEVLFNQKREVS